MYTAGYNIPAVPRSEESDLTAHAGCHSRPNQFETSASRLPSILVDRLTADLRIFFFIIPDFFHLFNCKIRVTGCVFSMLHLQNRQNPFWSALNASFNKSDDMLNNSDHMLFLFVPSLCMMMLSNRLNDSRKRGKYDCFKTAYGMEFLEYVWFEH